MKKAVGSIALVLAVSLSAGTYAHHLENDTKCTRDRQCKSGICILQNYRDSICKQSKLELNAECYRNSDCQSDLCVVGRCREVANAEKESCNKNSDCQKGLWCPNDYGSYRHTCISIAGYASGAECSESIHCQSGHCVDKACF